MVYTWLILGVRDEAFGYQSMNRFFLAFTIVE